MNLEIWKPVTGFEGLYEVSNKARVKSLAVVRVISRERNGKVWTYTKTRKEVILKQSNSNSKRYWRVTLTDNEGKRHHLAVHRLVAIAFIPNPKDLPQVNHIDANRDNNLLENLEWCTNQYNKWHYFNVAGGEYKYTKEGRKRMIEGQSGRNSVNWRGFYNIDGRIYETMPAVAEGEGVSLTTVQRRLKSPKFPNWYREDVVQAA